MLLFGLCCAETCGTNHGLYQWNVLLELIGADVLSRWDAFPPELGDFNAVKLLVTQTLLTSTTMSPMRAWGSTSGNSSPGVPPSKRPLETRANEEENAASSAGPSSIKRRLVRPKALRRPEEQPAFPDGRRDELSGSPNQQKVHQQRSASPLRAQTRSRTVSPVGQIHVDEPPDGQRHPSPKISTSSHSPVTAKLPPSGPIYRGKPPRSHLVPLRSAHPPLIPCRSVYSYTRLNHIEEGTYGVVFRAKCNDTNEIYALKKLKLEEEKQGFPITSLREVMALMVAGGHENVVGIREIVVGDTLNQ